MEIQMEYYLIVSAVMFFAGVYGFITRRNLIAVLISIELILNAVDINFAVFNRYLFPDSSKGFSLRSSRSPSQRPKPPSPSRSSSTSTATCVTSRSKTSTN